MYKIPSKFHLKINRKLFLKPDPPENFRGRSKVAHGSTRNSFSEFIVEFRR